MNNLFLMDCHDELNSPNQIECCNLSSAVFPSPTHFILITLLWRPFPFIFGSFVSGMMNRYFVWIDLPSKQRFFSHSLSFVSFDLKMRIFAVVWAQTTAKKEIDEIDLMLSVHSFSISIHFCKGFFLRPSMCTQQMSL